MSKCNPIETYVDKNLWIYKVCIYYHVLKCII